MIKLSFGGILVLILSLCLPLFIYTYSLGLWELFCLIDLSNIREASFAYSFVTASLLTFIFLSSDSFFSILNHELTHNLWAVFSFSRPTSLEVKAGKGGNFAFKGRKNIMTVLSPYFFPLITLFLFPLYFIISNNYVQYYFIALGLSFGYSFATEIKQAHFSQPDLRVYGLLPSYLIILFFQVFIFGLLLSFVCDSGVLSFIIDPCKKAHEIILSFF
ncbi:MAG: hypothetical protein RR363_03525 [Rikenellaceae bacterium]